MSIKIKKKNLKIIIAIIIVILIIVGIICLIPFVKNNILIKQTEKKLSQIDTEELEEKLIEQLKKTNIYINSGSKPEIITEFGEGTNFNGYVTATIKAKYGEYLVAGIIEIPCFKINSDSNGNFKSIEYNKAIKNTIKAVFKDNYDIDLTITGNEKYCKRFNEEVSVRGTTKTGNIYVNDMGVFSDMTFLEKIVSIIKNRNSLTETNEYAQFYINTDGQYSTTTFGLEF